MKMHRWKGHIKKLNDILKISVKLNLVVVRKF